MEKKKDDKVKIISWNVNGIRAAIRNGFMDWLNETDAEIICLQEVKAYQEQVKELNGIEL